MDSPDSVETELKLAVDATAIGRLRRHPLVARLRLERPVTRRQRSIYFDTPELHLHAAGLALRIRQDGRRRVQTVKTAGETAAGLFRRREWEHAVDGELPDLSRLRGDDLPAALSDPALTALRPVFSTEVRRSRFLLGDESFEVEMVIDEGRLLADGAALPISEVELELRRGHPHHLFDLALALQRDLPTRAMIASKSDRGYALLGGAAPRPSKAPPAELAPELTASEAFRHIARGCLRHLLANEDCLHATQDPEAVHQMRVALRRFRSAAGLFNGVVGGSELAALRGEMRWILDRLGPARDLDVLLAEAVEPAADALADPAVDALKIRLAARRAALYESALAALREPRFTRLILAIGRWIEGGDWLCDPQRRDLRDEPVKAAAAGLLEKRYRQVRKAGRRFRHLPEEKRHLLRIRVKKLRYACEFLESLFPARPRRRFLAALAVLQEHLGVLNDIAVARRLLAAETGDGAAGTWAAGLVAGWQSARAGGALEGAAGEWRGFNALPPFWRAPDEG